MKAPDELSQSTDWPTKQPSLSGYIEFQYQQEIEPISPDSLSLGRTLAAICKRTDVALTHNTVADFIFVFLFLPPRSFSVDFTKWSLGIQQ